MGMQLCQAVEGQVGNIQSPTILHINSEDNLVLWPWYGIPEQNFGQVFSPIVLIYCYLGE